MALNFGTFGENVPNVKGTLTGLQTAGIPVSPGGGPALPNNNIQNIAPFSPNMASKIPSGNALTGQGVTNNVTPINKTPSVAPVKPEGVPLTQNKKVPNYTTPTPQEQPSEPVHPMDIFGIPKANASGDYSEQDLKFLKTMKDKGESFEDAMKMLDSVKQAQTPTETPEQGNSAFRNFIEPSIQGIKQLGTDIGGIANKTWEAAKGGAQELGDVYNDQYAGGGKYNLGEAAARGAEGALKIATSPFAGIGGQAIEDLKSPVQSTYNAVIPQDIKDKISSFTGDKTKQVTNWYNKLPDDQKRDLQNAGVGVNLLLNFVGAGTAENAVKGGAVKGTEEALVNAPKGKVSSVFEGISKLPEKIESNLAPKGISIKGGLERELTPTELKASVTPKVASTQKIAEAMSNKLNKSDALKFKAQIGETPQEFAVKRGMTKVGTDAVDEAVTNYKTSMKQADKSFDTIDGTFKYSGGGNDPVKTMLSDLEKRGINTEADYTGKIQNLDKKYSEGGLTMNDINDIKRTYAQNFKYSWADMNSESAQRSTNLQNKLREWQFKTAKENGLSNIDEINKNTKAWKMYADALSKKLGGQEMNNNVSLTDWITLAGGTPENLAMFAGKKLLSSNPIRELGIKTFGNATKEPIIKSNLDSIIKSNVEKQYADSDILSSGMSSSNPSLVTKPKPAGLLPSPSGKPTIGAKVTNVKPIIPKIEKPEITSKSKIVQPTTTAILENKRAGVELVESKAKQAYRIGEKVNEYDRLLNNKTSAGSLDLQRRMYTDLKKGDISIDTLDEIITRVKKLEKINPKSYDEGYDRAMKQLSDEGYIIGNDGFIKKSTNLEVKPINKTTELINNKPSDSLIEEAKKYKSAEEFINSQIGKDYRGAHQLTLSDSITADKVNIGSLKEDIRKKRGYLSKYDLNDLKKFEKLLDNPEDTITIYRATPKNELNSGDWVTTDKIYANDIKKQNGGKVYSFDVKVKDLRFPKDTSNLPSSSMASTFNYSPDIEKFKDIYNQAHKK